MNEAGISVSELNLMVMEAIRKDPRTRSVLVRGEVSGFKHHIATGHWYFSLKDPDSSISCVMFRTAAAKAQLRPSDGDQVLAEGYVDVYAAQGKYQLYVTGLRRAGLGDMYIRLEELKRKLAAEGLFDPGRKKTLPMRPGKVAVVTSQSGAALHDILNVSGMRCPSVPIVLIPVTVQGSGAGKEIAEGIRKADQESGADVMIVARGGGSAEDLWCFNDEAVVRAIAACRIPVVSGVGHEIDTTLCDLVSDVRASTPSNAAEIVFPDRRELSGRVNLCRSGLVRACTGMLQQRELRLKDAAGRLSALSPEKRLALLLNQKEMNRIRLCTTISARMQEHAAALDSVRSTLRLTVSEQVREAKHATEKMRERLTAVSPMAVLQRGYAMVYNEHDQLLTRAAEAEKQEAMTLQFADGRVTVTRKDMP